MNHTPQFAELRQILDQAEARDREGCFPSYVALKLAQLATTASDLASHIGSLALAQLDQTPVPSVGNVIGFTAEPCHGSEVPQPGDSIVKVEACS